MKLFITSAKASLNAWTLASKESYFLFDEKLYHQVDCVAMVYFQGPTLANIILYHYEDIWLHNCLLECKPSYYKQYTDDIFVLFELETQVGLFENFMNSLPYALTCLNFIKRFVKLKTFFKKMVTLKDLLKNREIKYLFLNK